MKPVIFPWDGAAKTLINALNVTNSMFTAGTQITCPDNISDTKYHNARSVNVTAAGDSTFSVIINGRDELNLSVKNVQADIVGTTVTWTTPNTLAPILSTINYILVTNLTVPGTEANRKITVSSPAGTGYSQPFTPDMYQADAQFSVGFTTLTGSNNNVTAECAIHPLKIWDAKQRKMIGVDPINLSWQTIVNSAYEPALENIISSLSQPASAIRFSYMNCSGTGVGTIMQQGS